MISTKRWLSFFLSIVSMVFGTMFAINYSIDPFGNRDWIVSKQYKPIVHERSEKYAYLFQPEILSNYDCLILGSSRVMSINPSLNKETQHCYNFGVHVANNPEKLFILQEWLKRAPLTKIYIGNELYNVHGGTRPNHLNARAFIGGSEQNYLSPKTFNISLKALYYQIRQMPQTYFLPNGSIHYTQKEQEIANHAYDQSKHTFHHLSQGMVQGDYIHQPFTYNSDALAPLRQIKMLCDKHQIKIYPFITPMYYDAHQTLNDHPLLKNGSQRFRHDLINIFGTVYDFDIDTPQNREPINFYDPVHYRPYLGNLMIKRMNNQGIYGVIITKNSL